MHLYPTSRVVHSGKLTMLLGRVTCCYDVLAGCCAVILLSQPQYLLSGRDERTQCRSHL